MNKSFAIITLGCKTNQFESASMAEKLRAAGYVERTLEDGVALVLINTCTVTANTDAQSRKLIRRAQRYNPAARLVVTGCYAQRDAQALTAIPGVSLVLGNQEKNDLLEHLEGPTPAKAIVSDIRSSSAEVALELSSEVSRSRAFLQIQNGCDAFCSYCIIPYARGRSRSVSAESILEQVCSLVQAGHEELVLTGIHIGQYGKDLTPASDLLTLTRQIVPQLKHARLRLGSLEPTELPLELRQLIATTPNVCAHYHIPLQAGTDALLRAMNRKYTTAFFAKLLGEIRQQQPHAGIGIDLIVGFPGETDADFEQAYKFVDSLPLNYLHVFPYSRRPGTPAAELVGQVSGNVAKERAARMRQLSQKKLQEFAKGFVGQTLEVIPEGGIKVTGGDGDDGGMLRAVADNYLQVYLPVDETLIGQRCRVEITALRENSLLGRVVSVGDD